MNTQTSQSSTISVTSMAVKIDSYHAFQYRHPRVNVQNNVRRQTEDEFYALLPFAEEIAKKVKSGEMREISDWGGGWSWNATLINGITIDGHSVEYHSSKQGVSLYYPGDNGSRHPALIFLNRTDLEYRP